MGKFYVGQLDARLVALDQRTGEPAWSIQAEKWQDGFTITSAPLYFNGMVITGFAGGEIGVRGRVKAYSAKDGSLLWTFYTIPGPGHIGHDTWPQTGEAWLHGGASVWQTPAVDPALGLLYLSTGNPAPDYNGVVRAGDNLFSASIVAIDVKTGQYRWHFQEVHHDIWDYDAPNPVVLFDLAAGGVTRKAIAQAGKTGWVYILDRTNGKPIVGIEERPVPQEPRQATAATQPYPMGDAIVPQSVDIAPIGFTLVNQGRIFTPFVGAQGVIAAPSFAGGVNWPPSSYDPVRQVLLVCAYDAVGKFIGGDRDFEIPSPGKHYEGGVSAFADLPRMGIFAAMDMRTNRIVWRNRWPDLCQSGSATTAGGLVFVGRNDGRLMSLDAETGLPLWEFQTGAGMHATPSVFEYQREAVSRRLFSREHALGHGARRQRVAVRFAGNAEGDDAGRYGGACGCARVDNGTGTGRCQARRRGLSTDVRRLPRRQRGGRPRRPVAGSGSRRFRGCSDDHRRKRPDASIQSVADGAADPGRRLLCRADLRSIDVCGSDQKNSLALACRARSISAANRVVVLHGPCNLQRSRLGTSLDKVDTSTKPRCPMRRLPHRTKRCHDVATTRGDSRGRRRMRADARAGGSW